jgi:RHS repeat-associated protein
LTRTTGTAQSLSRFEFRFSTKPRDPATGLYYYGYRWYDPYTGGWINRDPIEERGGVNLYGFLGNNAVGRLDLLGLLARGEAENVGPISAWVLIRNDAEVDLYHANTAAYQGSKRYTKWQFGYKVTAQVWREKSEKDEEILGLRDFRGTHHDWQGVKSEPAKPNEINEPDELWKHSKDPALPKYLTEERGSKCVQCAVLAVNMKAEELPEDNIGVAFVDAMLWTTQYLPLSKLGKDVVEAIGTTVTMGGAMYNIVTPNTPKVTAAHVQIILCADGATSILVGGFGADQKWQHEAGKEWRRVMRVQSSIDNSVSPAQNYFRAKQ